MLGELVGHFRIVEQVGAGGMGVVYRAHDERLERDVALKVLRASLPADDAARRRFRHEALALSRLNHPNIATVYDFVNESGIDLLVMEFVQGTTLSDRVANGALGESEVVEAGVQLTAGLQCAHEAGVIHRDLKPGNLRLATDGRIKILDFGLARLLETEVALQTTHTDTDYGRPAGTLPYMAPEQLRGETPGVLTDVYAAGATLYELAAGRAPFHGTQLAIMDDILHRQPAPPSTFNGRISSRLDAVLLRAIDKQPSRRYQSARELGAALEDLRAPHRVVAPVPRRYVIGALATVVFVVTLAWPLRDRGHAPLAFQPRGWVLIADFENRTADRSLDGVLPESLAIALQQSTFVNVVGRDRVYAALARMKRPDASVVNEDVGLEICRREGFPLLLTGSLAESGGTLRIVARAVESDSGRLLFAETAELRDRRQLFAGIDGLAGRVRARLGESVAHIQEASAPLAQVTTSSLEALRRYSQGSDAFARGQLDRAAELLEGALMIDGDFAMAHRVLARVYSGIGNPAKELEHLGRAYQLRDTVSIREKHLIEGSYYSAREQYEEAERRFSQLATLYPDDVDARYELARARYASGNVAGAVSALREEIRLRPRSPRVADLLVPLLATSGSPEEALDVAAKAAAEDAPTPRITWGRGLAFFALGRLDDARREFRSLSAHGEGQANIGRLYLARVDLFEGHLHAAGEALAADIERDHQAGRFAAELVRRYLAGRLALLEERRADALREADAIAAAPAGEVRAANLRAAALLYVGAGRPDGARAMLARLQKNTGDATSAFVRSCIADVRGEIAMSEGRYRAAADAFTESYATYPIYLAHQGLARANAAAGDVASAVATWQRVLDAKGEILRDGFAPDWVLAHDEAGRVFLKSGDPERARSHAEQFLALWRTPDVSTLRRPAEELVHSLSPSIR